jgi:exodeoxyribonuclease VII small subunit
MSNQETYREAIEELEEIVSQIENEQIDVDALTEKVKRATLSNFAKRS